MSHFNEEDAAKMQETSKRAYLDADSDDEQSNQYHLPGETRRTVDKTSLKLTPKVTYDSEELEKLIIQVKKMTILSGLTSNTIWSEAALENLKVFFQNPSKRTLTVYMIGDTVTSELNFPSTPVRELTYFVRQQYGEIFNSQTFHERIIFGTNNDHVESTILNFIMSLAPSYFVVNTLPDRVKVDLFTNLHDFLANMTDFKYKMHGLTVLYLPNEGADMTVDEICNDKELLKRLKRVVFHWTKQIRLALADLEQTASYDLPCIKDEFFFWMYRLQNLYGLKHQIDSPTVQKIVNVLSRVQSNHILQFIALSRDIDNCTEEAKSNIDYLELLKLPCEDMNSIKSPEELLTHLPKILHLFRFICLHSPFYSTHEQSHHLIGLVNNQIITICRNFINLNDIFEMKKTSEGMEILQRCIETCENYRKFYYTYADAHDTLTSNPWKLNAENIFRHVDVFVERCWTVIDICQAMIDFARLNEKMDIAKPRFGGPKGPVHEKVCEKIEKIFLEHLKDLKAKANKILDVQDVTWHDDMFKFRGDIKDLENMIENLVNTVFKDINNVQEGITNLYGMQIYINRPSLKTLFASTTTMIWRLFADEIKSTKQEIVDERTEHPANTPYFAGRALNLQLKSKRLSTTKLQLLKSTWISKSGISEEVCRQCDLLSDSIKEAINNLYHKWINDIGNNPITLLDRNLIRKNINDTELLESNFHTDILDLCSEAKHWQCLGFRIPVYVAIIYDKWDTLQFVYESVLMLILSYNRIIKALSPEEKSLFHYLIKQLDNKIKPGLNKFTWNSESIDVYIKDCCSHASNLQNFLDTYKLSNREIKKLCEEICNIQVSRLRANYGYELYQLQDELNIMNNSLFPSIERKYRQIIEFLLVIFEGFQSVIQQSANEYRNYLINIDKLFEEACKLCIQCALNIMYTAIHGDEATGPAPLLVIEADLVNNKITLLPSFGEIARIGSSVTVNFMEPFKSIRRFVERFGFNTFTMKSLWEAFNEDERFIEIEKMLNDEVIHCHRQIQNYLTIWEPFKDIWEVDKDKFIEHYENSEPTVRSFDEDIGRYTELANSVQMLETVTTVHFLDINADRLKTNIIGHCSIWQEKLTTLLLRLTTVAVDQLYQYMTMNGMKINEEPRNIVELQTILQLYEKLCAEIVQQDERFAVIYEQCRLLEKYEMPLTLEFKRKVRDLDKSWKKYLECLSNAKLMIDSSKDQFKKQYQDQVVVLNDDISGLLKKFYDNGPFTSDWKVVDALAWLENYRKQMEILRQQEQQMKDNLRIFEINHLDSQDLIKIEKDLIAIEVVWQLTHEWEETWNRYKVMTFWSIETKEMETTSNQLYKKLTRLYKELDDKNWSIVEYSRVRVDKFRRTLPLITDLKNPAMRERHWNKIKMMMDHEFDQQSDDFTLNTIANMQMQNFSQQISDISNAASMELTIELGLKNIIATWQSQRLEMSPYRDKGIFRLQINDETFQILEDHQIQLAAMKSTRFVEPFVEDVNHWEKCLISIGEVLETVLQCQRTYMYLDNIFHGDDIRKQLPRETEELRNITHEWKLITSGMAKEPKILDACRDPVQLLSRLNTLNTTMEHIERALEQYLVTKRHIFPRFYFISNDDLLEIIGHSKRPDLIQPHIKKLFSNIKSLKISKLMNGKFIAEGMYSEEGEYVEFLHAVHLEGQVEYWLCEIETAMRDRLRDVLRQCRAALRKVQNKRNKWLRDWPSQSEITSTQIQWTTDCTKALVRCSLIDARKPLRKLRKRQNRVLDNYSEIIRGNLNKLERIKLKAIVVIEIHARDVIEKIYKAHCKDMSAFEWTSQLRFYWDREIDDCIIRQTNGHFIYGYEYLGNSERLVITPLTDRCYITLTTALHLYRGGNPKGPAGTGKTETVKDLGKALGCNVIVQNCSEGLDYKSMGRLFAGLAETGAWGCFDEFNRINIEVLSVVAQQILSILTALARKLPKLMLEGDELSLVRTCGIFITMNPGYAGRTELPDNLKSMFRPIAMMVPDSSMIAEISLFGEGFQDTRILARKVFTLYTLAQQQLSKQHHYDFGLRGIVTLTRYAGKKRRQYEHLTDDEIIILAMKDMNVAKLTADDLPLFNGITSDLFPGITIPPVNYDQLIDYISNEAVKLNLQPVPMLVTKVIQLYETKNSRHSTMIVGQSCTGKSSTWQTLRNTLTAMKNDRISGFNIVHDYPINPKALNLGELYGEYNLSTGEWFDGVIPSIMRKTCSSETSDEKWIIFDGPVDALWIENMNSVMDDNKILTLINNERITMPDQVSLLFEVEDLAVASPATVSRAGMVYHDYKDLGWRPLVDSWLTKHQDKPEFCKEMTVLFERYVDKLLTFKRQKCQEIVAILELNSVENLCKLLDILATPQNQVEFTGDEDTYHLICKLSFLFCLIWSICATVNEEGRDKIDHYFREMDGAFPLKDTVYEYYVDVKLQNFILWEEKLPLAWKYPTDCPFHKIIVPTVDTIRYDYLVNKLLTNGRPVLLVGPIATGKTLIAQSALESLDNAMYSRLVINMSGQTSSMNIQETIVSRLEKRMKGVYTPSASKTMIIFMDDFNMPMKDTYGSQPPLELIRQWMSYEFWYHRRKQSRQYIRKVQLLCAMGPAGGGRNTISNRLLTKFNIINLTFPAEKQIQRIYGTMLNQQLFDFHPEVKGIANEITLCTIEMYNNVVLKMLPTPGKIHYLFNLRDISKIFQGLLRSHKDYQYSRATFLRLWIHETYRVFNDRLIDESDREWFVTELNNQLGKHFELTFHNLCPEKRCPMFGNFMNAWSIYEELPDLANIRRYIEKQIDEFNATPGVVRQNLVLFRDAIEHICRIIRIITQPRGNLLLVGIGGNGRQSLTKIASYMSERNIFQIQVNKQYRVLEFREDLKRLYFTTGVDNQPTSFIFNDNQIVEEGFLEIINNMLGTGEIANLYKPDELEEIKRALTAEATAMGITPTAELIYLFFIERVRANMHIILCMSPIEDEMRNRLRQYPSLINCTTIDWFLPWPKDALIEVANKFLLDLNLITTITGTERTEVARSATALPANMLQDRMLDGIVSTFAHIHDSVDRYSRRMAAEMKRYCYVTPTNYLELVVGYKKMLQFKRHELTEQANKLRRGLGTLDDTREKVHEMAEELEVTQQQVLQSTKDCEEYLSTLVSQRRDADESQKSVTAKSIRIEKESKECKSLEELARADLATVEPALNDAMKALDALNKKDLAEIKSFTRPPPKVEMVLAAVMILKNSEPTWTESKRQLGDVNFLSSLRYFDKDHISDKTLKLIGKYTRNAEFDPEKVGQVSIAAKSLCMWVIAMEQYAKLYRVVAPKRAKLQSALASLQQKETALAEAVEQLKKLRDELENLQRMYDTKMKEKEDLIQFAELLKVKLERAAMLVDGLSGERVRWQKNVELFGQFYDCLPGNCLIATGFISYLGPFVSKYREELYEIWMNEIETKEIPCTPKLSLIKFLSDPTKIREWNIQGLPSDNFSTENGIIVTRASRWPLVIDPQCQALKWIKNMEAVNKLRVVDFGRRDLITILETALQHGEPVLLENVGQRLDPILNPILERSFIQLGDAVMIKFNEKMISYNENFRLYITTKLSNPHYIPEVCTKTTLCNFAIKEEGLEAQLLGIVVRKEKPQLEEQKDNLVLTIATGKKTLKDLEDKILHLLSVTTGSLLDDLNLLNALQTAKATSVTVQQSLIVSSETEKKIDQAREGYHACSKRATILFFILNDMNVIDPMYQFSLEAYVKLFKRSIEKSSRKSKQYERIESLNDYHTYAIYKNACRGLFERHKLLYSFHMCMKILEAEDKIIPREYDFLLKGGIVLDRENQPEKPADWLSTEIWDNISELDKLPGFHGIVSSFEQLTREWHNWYINGEPETIALPDDWQNSLNDFQKMLIIRSCRSDRMTFSITNFIIQHLGTKFVEPPTLDIKAVLDDSIAQAPLIFILSPGVDPTGILTQLAKSQNMSEKFMALSLGQGQTPKATEMIEEGSESGSWVFLANCHLSLSWMPELDKIVETLGNRKDLHSDFRLWLSSSPTSEFPISILQAGVKMTTEPPKGVKSNMNRLYNLITDEQFDICQARGKYKKLLFNLVFFHSILLERSKFQQLGWNVIYGFNDYDFQISENLLQIYLDGYKDTPWDALKYLIAGVCYGGHVTDDWDRRLLMTYVDQYFTEDVFNEPSYRLSTLSTYYTPRDGSLESYRDFITMLPTTDRPETFGQHMNAEITSLINETRTIFNTLMSLQVQLESSERETTKEDKVTQLAREIREILPDNIDYESAVKHIGMTKTPLDVVLLQELTRYNVLLQKTRDSLDDLQRGIKGLILMSESLEELFTCIYEGRVPSFWLKAYQSLKPLGSWTHDLILRVEHFSKWAETTHAPLLFWLAAFTFPTGFLTAVLQISARLWNLSIDTLSWEFSVFDGDDAAITETPENGVYVRGVFLEGAGWDILNGTLVEPTPMQLIYNMPVIHFKPTEHMKKKSHGIYQCPCYYYPVRSGSQEASSFVVAIDLKTGDENPGHWIQRGTALLLSLAV